ncbi:hypothetical protein M758_9G134200 [Ceratodon purpureus]|nr:hypothetical protein M758_9G134200 [Ceratodon purpureus]
MVDIDLKLCTIQEAQLTVHHNNLQRIVYATNKMHILQGPKLEIQSLQRRRNMRRKSVGFESWALMLNARCSYTGIGRQLSCMSATKLLQNKSFRVVVEIHLPTFSSRVLTKVSTDIRNEPMMHLICCAKHS